MVDTTPHGDEPAEPDEHGVADDADDHERERRLIVAPVEPDLADAFNVANLWRVETILRLGLTGRSRWMAASPGASFPQFLRFMMRTIEGAPPGVVVDLGAGLGGVAEAVRRGTRRRVIAFDAGAEAVRGARRLFPKLAPTRAAPWALPLRASSVAACYGCGLVSLLGRRRELVVEARRALAPEGRLVLVDLASSSDRDVRFGGSAIPSAERVLAMLERSGFTVDEQAVGQTSLSDWALADLDVAREIARTRRNEPDFDRWVDDRRRLERLMSSDRVVMFGVSACPAERPRRERPGSRLPGADVD